MRGNSLPQTAAILLCVQVLCGPTEWICAEVAPGPVSPFGKKPLRRDGREGVVVLSTGERFEGTVLMTRNSAWRFKDEETGENYEWTLAEIQRVVVEAQETFEPDWRWKEAGSDVKVYSGCFYRHADFKIAVTLTTGEKHLGHWRKGAPVQVVSGVKRRKFLLNNETKNVDKKQKKREDIPPLVYVREIVLKQQKGD